MKRFLMNWNYKKHGLAVTGFYLSTAVVANAILGKPVPKDEKTLCPVEVCRQMTKNQRIFNGILGVGYLIDMTAAFFLLNHWKKQYK